MSDVKLGTRVKNFLKMKAKISKKSKELEDLKSEANKVADDLIADMRDQKLKRFDVKAGSITLKETDVFNVKDWKKVWKYIFKTKNEALLQKRLGQAAVLELFEDGVKIPGTEKMKKRTLSAGFKRGA